MLKKLLAVFALFIVSLLFPTPAWAGITPPVTAVTQTPSSPNGTDGWYVSPVEFKLNSTDLESGVKEINYSIDGAAWQKVTFNDSANLAPNPSFETAGQTTSGAASWEAGPIDPEGSYAQDLTNYAPNFSTASARITATGGLWHGINHKTAPAATFPYQNMSASAWVKTQNVTGTAYFNVYALDAAGGSQLIATSLPVSGTAQWTRITLNFVVTKADTTGVYMDAGLSGPGTAWFDAVTLDSSTSAAATTVTVASDSKNHTFEYYAVDNVGNVEAHSCVTPKKNCIEFKLDQTPPGNWHDSGATRGFFGSSHELWVYTYVKDLTSGLSVFTDKYQYHTENNPGFGRFTNLLGCNSPWLTDQWVPLISPPFTNGVEEAFLLTPKTDFCNSNWKICKIVRFYAKDMAGNSDTKDFCINGPWIRLRGKGVVRANSYIDMLAEGAGDNTDDLVEISSSNIDFFTSSKDWYVRNVPTSGYYNYDPLWDISGDKTQITNGNLTASTGIYYVNGNFEIKNSTIPANYSTATFNQIVFINGDLTISNNVGVSASSTALFIVKGSVNVKKSVTDLAVAVFADGDFHTAYDASEGETTQTLVLHGLYSADKFEFQRTLQGTGNDTTPSEDFIYEPKYLIGLNSFFGNYSVTWKSIE